MSTKGNNSDNIIDVQHDNMNTSKLKKDVFFVFRIQPFFLDPFNNETFLPSVTHNDHYRILKHFD